MTDNFLIGQVTDKLMILQDHTSRMLIGAVKKRGRDCTVSEEYSL